MKDDVYEHLNTENKDRLREDALMIHMLFLAAAMAGGEQVERADKMADAAMDKLRVRFT